MKGSRSWLVVCLAVALTVLAVPSAAQAHDECVDKHYEGTLRGVACIKGIDDTHFDLAGCDRRADTRRVRAWYWLAQTSTQLPSEWDPNGHESGCGHSYGVPNWFAMRICVEQPVGCSSWWNM